MKYHKRYLSCCLAVALFPALSFANEAIDEADVERIVVTAEFRDDSLLDLSSSVSVLDQSVIERRGANHIEHQVYLQLNLNQ